MSITVKATYEHGVLKLAQPIPLAEGTCVEVAIVRDAVESQLMRQAPANKVLADIAALPLEGDRSAFSGQDHDSILYSAPQPE